MKLVKEVFRFFIEFISELLLVLKNKNKLMATQLELAVQLKSFIEQLKKSNAEIIKAFNELRDALGTVTPEVMALMNQLAVEIQAQDDLVIDEVPPIDEVPSEEAI
jgi:hypothetical protein